MKTHPMAVPLSPALQPMPFHRKGVAYFFVFNDRQDWATINRHLEAFAAADHITALCLHPRAGLLMPYGGDEWFELIRRVCLRAMELDLKIWLYDEDPYPSGHAGGRIVAEHPELAARGIKRFDFDPHAQGDPTLFCFPAGNLVWCGLIHEETGEFRDITSRVGMLRRRWDIYENWDSRFFYPDTPLYHSPRAETMGIEYAVTVPVIPPGMTLTALVAQQAAFSTWSPYGDFIDTLNPVSARLFLESTHEQYRQAVGDLFGNGIEAIFTDEPKFFDPHPWTPGLFEDFMLEHGYDIRPYLHYLFSDQMSERACLTRLHYRYFVGARFRQSWLHPVASWCRDHQLQLVGHISPEDDPVEQAMCLTNLLPLMKEFDLCGIDLIIPALGDHDHPLLNVGVTCATSIAQQQQKQGVMTESGYYSDHLTAGEFGKILLWQCMMGVTTPLLHCSYLSVRGPRAFEKPDFGPDSKFWDGLHAVRQQIVEIEEVTHGARQIAPVAILWPIRSFNARTFAGQQDHTGLRREFTGLLAACLDHQIGTHIIDESDLPTLTMDDGHAVLGSARYSHILIPSASVLLAETFDCLRDMREQGVQVILAGQAPTMCQLPEQITAPNLDWCPAMDIEAVISALPRLMTCVTENVDLRCSAWEANGSITRLLINIGHGERIIDNEGTSMSLHPGVVYFLPG